ncbi:MAG: N-acetylmuramoyl-L-alanine amidase family protein [Clostridia bacterium]|nr:N-acetylmuramoyl-L-alanine amidase family protein [Clostridia bacterium]
MNKTIALLLSLVLVLILPLGAFSVAAQTEISINANEFFYNYCTDYWGDPITKVDALNYTYILNGGEYWPYLLQRDEVNAILKSNGQPSFDQLLNDAVAIAADIFYKEHCTDSWGNPIKTVTDDSFSFPLLGKSEWENFLTACQTAVNTLLAQNEQPTFEKMLASATAISEELNSRAESCEHAYTGNCDNTCDLCNSKRMVYKKHQYHDQVDVDCNTCGTMRQITFTGWYSQSGKWYYYENGTVITDCWKQIDDNWYYLNAEGHKLVDQWRQDSFGWCYLGTDGAMKTNAWVRDSVGWCYVGADGYCVTNCWKQDSKGWCYLDAQGRMATNKWIRDSQGWCFVGANGYCVTNCWKQDSHGWVYLNAAGRMATNCWVQDSLGWCYVGANGYAVTNCWKRDSVGWCYLNANGSMTKSQWLYDSGQWYYLDANGYMVTGTRVIGGKTYRFNASGVWVG